MYSQKDLLKGLKENIRFSLTWIFTALLLGSICGMVGALFHHSIDYVTEFRQQHNFIIYFMPLGGIIIVFLYHISSLKYEPGTNTVLQSVRQQERVPVKLAPAIFLATIITHLVGGSSGREGAALQIGGSLATALGRLTKVDKKNMTILVMCGMSAVFSALFGTPLTATIFSMEVVSVGAFYYAAFLPCLCSALVAFFTAQVLGCHSVSYDLGNVMVIDAHNFVYLIGLSACLALVSIIFVVMMHQSNRLFKKYFANPYVRVLVGSVMLLVLVLIFGTDYLGAGMNVVDSAIYEQVRPYDFLLKMLFTAITIGCGFKGGEIVPTFFIGATLGYTTSGFLCIDPHMGAALGIIGLFCCVVNSPITSLIMAVEIFGSANLLPFALVIAFCNVLSGYFSLYHAQKFVYSKTSPELINKDAL